MSNPFSSAAFIRNGIVKYIPSAQLFRYILVGGWNTLFGYTCFFLINRWLSHLLPAYSYIAASLASNLIAITVAFLGYKWFVFQTKGSYLREWLRSLVAIFTVVSSFFGHKHLSFRQP